MDDWQTPRDKEGVESATGGHETGMAIRGAEIVRVYEGPFVNVITYRRRCDNCEYVPPGPPISVSILPYGTVAHGTYHTTSFVCPFCESRQVVELQG